jgi:hypothetical protein
MLIPSNAAPGFVLRERMLQTCHSVSVALLLILGASSALQAQVPAPAGYPVANLRPALANVQTAIGNLSIQKWKVSSEVRAATQQDVASMQRDLTNTLPGLLTQVESQPSGPAALSPSFAVFRNVDALYDVLLRVTETAAITASSYDANSLDQARAGLEDARNKLGAWLVDSIGAQDATVVRLQAAATPKPDTAAPAPAKIVVDDGPATTTKPRKKKSANPPATQAPQ